MTTFLVIVLVILMIMVVVSLVRGIVAFLQSHRADIEAGLNSLHAGLARLPVVEREVLTLFYLQEQSLAETADVLGIPVGTVKSRLFRARLLLRRELENEGWQS